MRQHPIDLMPATIRERNRVGVRTSRCVTACAIAAGLIVMVSTHARLQWASAESDVRIARLQAATAFALETKVTEVGKSLEQARAYIRLYEKASFPIDTSAIVATVIQALPASVTLEQIDLDAGVRSMSRSPRSKGDAKAEQTPRTMRMELSGFAASDEHIAQLVSRLELTEPFKSVNLDFSRTKKVNERDAREFRLSLKVDLNARYTVAFTEGKGGFADAQ